jgi:hypothetical protein
MSYIRNKSRYLVIGLMLAVFSGIMLFGFMQVANAEGRGSGSGHHEVMDSRHGHNHAYPVTGRLLMATQDTISTEGSGIVRSAGDLLSICPPLVL